MREIKQQSQEQCPNCGNTPTLMITEETWWDWPDPEWEAVGEYKECPKCQHLWDALDYRQIVIEL